jgi:putative serine protease PepD
MAVGSPFGLEKSVSAGIISGLGRSDLMNNQSYITAYIDLIQTDAAINPGNSGGALVDKTGKFIGINSLINSTSGSSAGVGFAIPVDTVAEIANQLMETGTATHAFLGIGTQTVTPEVAEAYGFPTDTGAVVASVSAGSPAEKAGIKKGDIIVKIGDDKITSTEEVFSAVRSHDAGDEISVEFYRGGEKQSVKATLGTDKEAQAEQQQEQQQQEQQQQQQQTPNGDGSSSSDPHNGFTLEELYELLRQQGLGQ